MNDQIKLNTSKTNHLNMIKYLRNRNMSLIDDLVFKTVFTINDQVKNNQVDQNNSIDRRIHLRNSTLYKISIQQLKNPSMPLIIYSNYRKLFNETLERIYKKQVSLKRYFYLFSDLFIIMIHNRRFNFTMIDMKFEIFSMTQYVMH